MRHRKCAIDVDKLEELVLRLNYQNKGRLSAILTDLREGAKIGVASSHRVSSVSTNALSALEHGQEVTDALIDWLEEGLIISPF